MPRIPKNVESRRCEYLIYSNDNNTSFPLRFCQINNFNYPVAIEKTSFSTFHQHYLLVSLN
jgi:hypothetical protein